MTGGAIRNNSVTNVHSGDGGVNGGGIALSGNSTFEMLDGVIEDNSIDDLSTNLGSWSSGGGVSLDDNSLFYLKGGKIRRNTCYAAGTNEWGSSVGGGVISVNSGVFMTGGVISGNSVAHNINPNFILWGQYMPGALGGGIYIANENGYLIKTGGIIYGNEVTGNDEDGFPLKNTAQSDAEGLGGGHACFVSQYDNAPIAERLRRNSTAYATDNMDSSVSGSAGGWE
jgi:hypothetical protein